MKLDKGRMKYVWSAFAEQTYQHLKRIDEIEWRVFRSNGAPIYISYIDRCPTAYYNTSLAHSTQGDIENKVLASLIEALGKKIGSMKVLSEEDRKRWIYPKKGYTTWNEFDRDACECEPNQECGGCSE